MWIKITISVNPRGINRSKSLYFFKFGNWCYDVFHAVTLQQVLGSPHPSVSRPFALSSLFVVFIISLWSSAVPWINSSRILRFCSRFGCKGTNFFSYPPHPTTKNVLGNRFSNRLLADFQRVKPHESVWWETAIPQHLLFTPFSFFYSNVIFTSCLPLRIRHRITWLCL